MILHVAFGAGPKNRGRMKCHAVCEHRHSRDSPHYIDGSGPGVDQIKRQLIRPFCRWNVDTAGDGATQIEHVMHFWTAALGATKITHGTRRDTNLS